jgi:hypothetical protein
MLKVERKKINKQTYIVTDYMYNDDNVGINLKTLSECKTSRKQTIPCIPISYSENSFSGSSSSVKIESNIGLDKDDNVLANFNIEYPDKNEHKYVRLEDQVLANDMINTCILNKKDIKDIKCYKDAINNTLEEIKNNSLEQNILIKTKEMNYKCYVYTDDLVFLGVANRLLENANNTYVLGEYCGKKLTDFIDEYGDTTKLIIDVCINDDITLQLKGIELVNAIDSTMGYATINTSSARVVRINNTHNDINFKVPEEFVLPEYKPSYNYENYYENFLLGNSPSNIERFYKMNKPSTNPTININKYLIW